MPAVIRRICCIGLLAKLYDCRNDAADRESVQLWLRVFSDAMKTALGS